MSKTDKTQPLWLREWNDGEWNHDHRHGECRPETFEYAREYAAGARRYYHWHRDPNCGRWKSVWEPPHINSYLTISNGWFERVREEVPGQWTRVLDPARPCKVCDAQRLEPTCERKLPKYEWPNAPRWYRNNFEREARAESRVVLHNAAREWNAEGDTDIEPTPYRHRHNANWYWW